MGTRLMLREVISSRDRAVASMVGLWEDAFPLATREPTEQWLAEIDALKGVVYIEEVDSRTVGLVRWQRLRMIRASLVIHIAVDPSQRGKGLGHRLWEAVREQYPGAPILFEVVRPHDDGSQRTWDWYMRKGARVLSDTYWQPPLRAGEGRVPLVLMVDGEMDIDPAQAQAILHAEAYGE